MKKAKKTGPSALVRAVVPVKDAEEEVLLKELFKADDVHEARKLFKEVRRHTEVVVTSVFRIGEIMNELSLMTSRQNFERVLEHLGKGKKSIHYAMQLAAMENDEWKVCDASDDHDSFSIFFLFVM